MQALRGVGYDRVLLTSPLKRKGVLEVRVSQRRE